MRAGGGGKLVEGGGVMVEGGGVIVEGGGVVVGQGDGGGAVGGAGGDGGACMRACVHAISSRLRAQGSGLRGLRAQGLGPGAWGLSPEVQASSQVGKR